MRPCARRIAGLRQREAPVAGLPCVVLPVGLPRADPTAGLPCAALVVRRLPAGRTAVLPCVAPTVLSWLRRAAGLPPLRIRQAFVHPWRCHTP
jgi:hypothetical protein